MAILSLIARLGLDGTGFQQGLRKAEGMGSRFAGSLKSQLAGAFSVAAVTQFARSVVNHVNRIKDLSEQYQVTTDDVQRLDYAAKQSGMTFEEVGAALIKLGAARQDAAEGNDELRTKFARFGVSLADLNDRGKSTKDLLKQIADALRTMEMNPRVQSDFRDLAGRTAPKLLQILKDLESIKFNPIPEDTIRKIEEATQKIENLMTKAKGFAAVAAVDVVESAQRAQKDKPWWKTAASALLPAGLKASLAVGDIMKGHESNESARLFKQALLGPLAKAGLNTFNAIAGINPARIPLFEEKTKPEALKKAAADRFKAMDSDSLARIGGYIGQTTRQDLITPEVKRIVTMLQRGLKIQDL